MILDSGLLFLGHPVCVQPTVDYTGFTRTVGVVWVCRRFEYSHFCRHFGVAVLTIDQSYSCTSANQQSVHLNNRHSTVDEY